MALVNAKPPAASNGLVAATVHCAKGDARLVVNTKGEVSLERANPSPFSHPARPSASAISGDRWILPPLFSVARYWQLDPSTTTEESSVVQNEGQEVTWKITFSW
jgi:hypothetical protein